MLIALFIATAVSSEQKELYNGVEYEHDKESDELESRGHQRIPKLSENSNEKHEFEDFGEAHYEYVRADQKAPDDTKLGKSASVIEIVELDIYFKLDPLLTQGLQMGERWVSPNKFTSVLQSGKQGVVNAHAKGRDSRKNLMRVHPKWVPEDPKMIKVEPSEGPITTITVLQAGESHLNVISGDVSTTLTVISKYREQGERTQIIITQ